MPRMIRKVHHWEMLLTWHRKYWMKLLGLGPHSDIFSLGMIALEMAAGTALQ